MCLSFDVRLYKDLYKVYIIRFIQCPIDRGTGWSVAPLSSAFTDEEIEQAKSLLFGCVAKPKTRRKGQGKMSRDLDDIISLIKATDPEELPIFVSRDLHKLPPATFDHVDVTRLLRDIVAVQRELREIQEKYATEVQYATVSELEQLKREMETLKKASTSNSRVINNETNVNFRRGAFCVNDDSCYDYCNSGPIGMTHSANRSLASSRSMTPPVRLATNKACGPEPASAHLPSLSYANVAERKTVSLAHSPVAESVDRRNTSTAENANQLISTSQYDAPKKSTNITETVAVAHEEGEGEWTRVERRKRRNNNARFTGRQGKAKVDENSKSKAAVINIPLYIYNVSKETTADNIAEYIMEKTNVAVKPEKICMREVKGYDSYKIFIPRQKLSLFEDDDLWPYDIFFRRYFMFRNRNTKDLRSTNSNITKNGEQ